MFYQTFVFFSCPTFRNSISSPSGVTVLMYSALSGHVEVAKLLVSFKCDVNASHPEYAHTPNLFLKFFTKNLFCFHVQLFVTPSLLPAVALLYYWPLPLVVMLKLSNCWFPQKPIWLQETGAAAASAARGFH
jgi:hypothetical protein